MSVELSDTWTAYEVDPLKAAEESLKLVRELLSTITRGLIRISVRARGMRDPQSIRDVLALALGWLRKCGYYLIGNKPRDITAACSGL